MIMIMIMIMMMMMIIIIGQGQHFQAQGHRFTIQTDPKPDNNMFFFLSGGKLACKWSCLRNFVIELAYAPSANHLYLKKF